MTIRPFRDEDAEAMFVRIILCCFKSIASRGRPRRFPKGDASPVASPPKAEVESGATMIGKPFGE